MIERIAQALNPISGIAAAAKSILTSIKGDPEKQAELALEAQRIELQLEMARLQIAKDLEKLWIDDANSLRDQVKVELQSEDPFVRRARPAWLWGLLGMYLVNYAGTAVASIAGASVAPVDIPNEVHLLAGVLVGGYGYLRTIEKRGAKPPLSK